jgi:hypothetical protein
MDSVTLLVTLALTFTLAVVSARQLLEGVLYMMARNTGTTPLGAEIGGESKPQNS